MIGYDACRKIPRATRLRVDSAVLPIHDPKALPDLRCRLGSRVPSAGQLAGYAGMRLRKHNAKAAVSSKSRTAGTRVSGVCVGRLEQCSPYASLCAAREKAAECWRCEDIAVMFLKTATKIDLSRRPHVQRHCCKNQLQNSIRSRAIRPFPDCGRPTIPGL